MTTSLTTKMLMALRWHHNVVKNNKDYIGTDTDKVTQYVLEKFKDIPDADFNNDYNTIEDFIND